jgi:hypothetical protein
MATEQALGRPVTALADMIWGPPPDGPLALTLRLLEAGGETAFAIGTDPRGYNHVGTIAAGDTAGFERVHLARLRAGMKPVAWQPVAGAAVEIGSVYRGTNSLLALVRMPAERALFDPRALDAAWQLVRMLASSPSGALLFPRALHRLAAARPVPDEATIHVARTKAGFDVSVLDASGQPCLILQGLTVVERDRLTDIPREPV